MTRPNWFLAFPIQAAFVLDLPVLPGAFRRFHPEDVHLTLAFLGGVTEEGAARALAALDRELARSRPRAFEVQLDEVVPMGGSRRDYSALSALLARGQGREEVTALVSALRDPLLDAANVRRDERPVKPHVTLARPTARASADERAAGLGWAASLQLGSVRARLDRIALYTWSELRRERLFRVVSERPLA